MRQQSRLYAFLQAARGNWRNAVFIECRRCPYGKADLCSGFLLAPDANGRPVMITAEVLREAGGEAIDKTECLAVINRESFESLFALWLTWRIDSPDGCALCRLTECNPCGNTR